jgi:hypothetical protein
MGDGARDMVGVMSDGSCTDTVGFVSGVRNMMLTARSGTLLLPSDSCCTMPLLPEVWFYDGCS